MINHPSGVNLLAAPLAPVHGPGLSEKQTVFVAETLVSRASFVVVDAPPVLSPSCVGLLKSSDLIIFVVTPEIATIQSTLSTLRSLVGLGVSGKKVHLLLNHPSTTSGLTRQIVERGLKRSISFEIPYDPNQPRALAQGFPLSLGNARSPLPDAIVRLAAALMKAN
jgi:pilus assembly protein CpaE